jgi:lipoyl(octanoyl) transferase
MQVLAANMAVYGAAMAIEWRISDRPEDYPGAVAWMERRAAEIRAGTASDCVWLLEHPPLYTAGTSAREADLLVPDRLPVYRTGRGGQFTYHGPGQRVAYVMLDLKPRGNDVRRFVHDLEAWMIAALDRFALRGERRPGRVGIWIARPGGREDKIAAIGVRVRRWVTFHGVSLNVDPDLAHFQGIVPCGVEADAAGPGGPQLGVTSLYDLGLTPTMAEVDSVLRETFAEVFAADAAAPARLAL